MLQPGDKKKVSKAVSELGRRVTAADVSTKTGLPVLLVSQALNQIASESSGHLTVSQSGDIVYSFPPGFSNVYLTRGLRRFLEAAADQLIKASYFLLKISFGIMLILSFGIIVLTFFVLMFAQGSGGSRRRVEIKFNYFDYALLRDIFYSLTCPPQSSVKYDYSSPTVRLRAKSNFLLDCFSFLFGDGDPNEGLEEKRWQLIAKVIKQHNNVLTAEQLAPYTGADPEDEDAVLPVLVRFNGKPEVSESGNIIYTFPEMASTAAADEHMRAPAFLQEFPLKFTEISESSLRPVYLIAGLNFAGSWSLWLLLHSGRASGISFLYTCMVVYGSLFVIVPLIRLLAIRILNRRIEERNRRRAGAAHLLLSPDAELKRKIAESREYRTRDRYLGAQSAIYSTEKSALDQEDELDARFKIAEQFDARPEESFDASP